jgi:hypothetical protein
MIPRAQGTEVCVSHNANVVPVNGRRYLMSAANYQGGNTIVDFTDVSEPTEVAYSASSTPSAPRTPGPATGTATGSTATAVSTAGSRPTWDWTSTT